MGRWESNQYSTEEGWKLDISSDAKYLFLNRISWAYMYNIFCIVNAKQEISDFGVRTNTYFIDAFKLYLHLQ